MIILNLLDYEFSFRHSSIMELGLRELRKESSNNDEVTVELADLKQGDKLKNKISYNTWKINKTKSVVYGKCTSLSYGKCFERGRRHDTSKRY